MAIGEKGQSILCLNLSMLPILGNVGIQLYTLEYSGNGIPEARLHPLRMGWRNFFSTVLEKFLQPIHAPRVYGT